MFLGRENNVQRQKPMSLFQQRISFNPDTQGNKDMME